MIRYWWCIFTRKIIPNLSDSLKFLDCEIKRTPFIKFLGLILAENLTWNQHIYELCNKLKGLFHIFYNIREYLSKKEIQSIYYALVYSRIRYGINIYGQAGTSKIIKIQTLQNQLLKVLSGKKYHYSTTQLHKELGLLLVEDLAKQELLTFVHNYFSNNLPPVFDNYYEMVNHPYHNRNCPNSIRIKQHNTDIATASVLVKGAKLWNDLNNSFKTLTNRKTFKAFFKSETIKLYNWTLQIWADC